MQWSFYSLRGVSEKTWIVPEIMIYESLIRLFGRFGTHYGAQHAHHTTDPANQLHLNNNTQHKNKNIEHRHHAPPSRWLPEAPILQVSAITVRRRINHDHHNMVMYILLITREHHAKIQFQTCLPHEANRIGHCFFWVAERNQQPIASHRYRG